MSGSFEWQSHQVREQIQARMQEAASHRYARPGSPRIRFSLSGFAASLMGVLVKALAAFSIKRKAHRSPPHFGTRLTDR